MSMSTKTPRISHATRASYGCEGMVNFKASTRHR